MKQLFKYLGSVAVACLTSSICHADQFADLYFQTENLPLDSKEKAAVELSQQWGRGERSGAKPFMGEGGSVKLLFGAGQHSIVCAVLQVCDIALEPGEQLTSLNTGDAVRWTVLTATSGAGDNETTHLIVKPLDVALETSLIVTTDRRVYHLRLKSHRSDYMSQVSFAYPTKAKSAWVKETPASATESRERISPKVDTTMLSFNYLVTGSAKWKPLEVYNDGRKTIIEMPKALSSTAAPTLLVVRREAGLFSDEETVMVNYRFIDQRYIVDSVFDTAILISGVGSDQERVTIKKEG